MWLIRAAAAPCMGSVQQEPSVHDVRVMVNSRVHELTIRINLLDRKLLKEKQKTEDAYAKGLENVAKTHVEEEERLQSRMDVLRRHLNRCKEIQDMLFNVEDTKQSYLLLFHTSRTLKEALMGVENVDALMDEIRDMMHRSTSTQEDDDDDEAFIRSLPDAPLGKKIELETSSSSSFKEKEKKREKVMELV